jgi:cellulose synthase (UDP-forming)
MSHYTKDIVIPIPPRKDEYYRYLGKQPLRLLSVLLFAVSLGSVYGIWAVFTKSPVWYAICVILLAVLIPWSIYIVVLATFRPRITWDSHQKVKNAGSHMLTHSVDVLIPVRGEDIRVIENTVRHVKRMRWQGPIRIYLLDDGASREVQKLASRYQVTYGTRDNRPDYKKSGNLNFGMAISEGEFVVVFDADFAPAKDFLNEVIPYFLYSNVGIVQTSQYFDVSKRKTRNWIQQFSSSTQDMFFCWAQPARNTADAGMCVGTNVAYRRSALEKIGGFPKVDDGGEDIITGLELYTAGYRTLYVPLNLAKGVCPDSFSSAVNQQYRWARSSMSMFVGKNYYSKAFKDAPLNLRQKMVFWSGGLYYLQSVLALLTLVLPSIVMLWAFPYQVGPGNYLPIAPAMLGMMALPLIIRGWRPSVLRLVVVYSVAHLLSAIDTVRGRSAQWHTTGSVSKSQTLASKAGIIVRVWVVVTQLATWAALANDLPVYGWSAYWPAVLLCTFQTIVLAPLLFPGYGTIAQTSLIPHLIVRRARLSHWRKQLKALS